MLEQVQEVIDEMEYPAGMSVTVGTALETGLDDMYPGELLLWVIQKTPDDQGEITTSVRMTPIPDFAFQFSGKELQHAIALFILHKLIDKVVRQVKASTYYKAELLNNLKQEDKTYATAPQTIDPHANA